MVDCWPLGEYSVRTERRGINNCLGGYYIVCSQFDDEQNLAGWQFHHAVLHSVTRFQFFGDMSLGGKLRVISTHQFRKVLWFLLLRPRELVRAIGAYGPRELLRTPALYRAVTVPLYEKGWRFCESEDSGGLRMGRARSTVAAASRLCRRINLSTWRA